MKVYYHLDSFPAYLSPSRSRRSTRHVESRHLENHSTSRSRLLLFHQPFLIGAFDSSLRSLTTTSYLYMSLKRSPSPTTIVQPVKSTMSSSVTALPASAGMQVKRLSPNAKLPTRGSALAAGYDLYA
jgi:hypothetical protein